MRRSRREERHSITVDGIDVTVVLKSIKNFYIRVLPPDGVVEVRGPLRATRSDVERVVRARSQWIRTSQSSIQQMRDRVREQSHSDAGNREDSTLIPVSMWDDERMQQSKCILAQRVEELNRTWLPIVGKTPSHVSFRAMTTRWGSCTPRTMRIRLNVALAFVPLELLEYVYVHELTHLYERGHGANFVMRISSYLPDWQRRKRALNSFGSYLV